MEEAEEDEDDPLDAFMSNLKAENDKHMFGNVRWKFLSDMFEAMIVIVYFDIDNRKYKWS